MRSRSGDGDQPRGSQKLNAEAELDVELEIKQDAHSGSGSHRGTDGQAGHPPEGADAEREGIYSEFAGKVRSNSQRHRPSHPRSAT